MPEIILAKFKWHLLGFIESRRNRRKLKRRNPVKKVFCIGLNKTGTTSWAQAMKDLGYVIGSETVATTFFYNWVHSDYDRIFRFIQTEGEAFQDIPFSLPETYKIVDHAFPESKFILTVRDSAEQWYQSLTEFHAKYWSKNGRVPPVQKDLEKAIYWRKGFPAEYCHFVFRTPRSNPYKRDILIPFYDMYCNDITNYFSSRPHDMLILNVSKSDSYADLCRFLGLPIKNKPFPWKNRT